jgi:hypothetical protein
MTSSASRQILLSEAEWRLISELLERERAGSTVELHHTSTRGYREVLKDRLEFLDRLIERFKEAPAVELA